MTLKQYNKAQIKICALLGIDLNEWCGKMHHGKTLAAEFSKRLRRYVI